MHLLFHRIDDMLSNHQGHKGVKWLIRTQSALFSYHIILHLLLISHVLKLNDKSELLHTGFGHIYVDSSKRGIKHHSNRKRESIWFELEQRRLWFECKLLLWKMNLQGCNRNLPYPCEKWGPAHRHSQNIYPKFPQRPAITEGKLKVIPSNHSNHNAYECKHSLLRPHMGAYRYTTSNNYALSRKTALSRKRNKLSTT